MECNHGRIWRATVQPTSTIVPEPGNSSQLHAQEVYTKTSLVANPNLQKLNQEILSASQAYNNTPKPFKRENNNETTATTTLSNLRSAHTVSPFARSDLQQVQFVQPNFEETPSSNGEQVQGIVGQMSQEENMAPKLVHKQYNSPIDLYSMNNIRKTIEAHTELIAPGIKGINFMKPETPVNKQSEVYKLVKEEEEQRNRAARLSPISGQPLSQRPIVASRSIVGHCEQHQSNLHQSQQENLVQHQPTQSNVRYCKITTQNTVGEQSQYGEGQTAATQVAAPNCCECGQFIVGPFAKIQNRFVHPQCFNCTTCGTSLKNTGYFTVNEKLYCEIHAKQVAKVMRLRFDFDERQDQQSRLNQQASTSRSQQSQSEAKIHQSGQQVSVAQNRQFNPNNNNTCTISTMFANRSNQDKRDTEWSWAPAIGNKDQTSAVESRAQTNRFLATSSSYSQQQELCPRRSPTPAAHIVQQQSIQSSNITERNLGQQQAADTPIGARMPICVHCHVRIQGPYVLAGKTTWCKLCSQNNFQCSSCYRSLLNTGFIEDSSHKYYCENCFEAYYAPICSKCNMRIKGDCLNALNKQWHPSCFVCGHCHRPFGNSSFYLEDSVPYCERDWNVLFTTKCFSCSLPIEAGDRWIEALNRNYHSNCFRCTSCQTNLEGSTFFCKGGKPYCRLHAR